MKSGKADRIASAQAVLRAASGRRLTSSTRITAANVSEYEPSRQAFERVAAWFKSAGFDVGNPAGNSFSITAPAEVFERTFKARVAFGRRGGIRIAGRGRKQGVELPLDALPEDLAGMLEAITFVEPPDFGPTKFS